MLGHENSWPQSVPEILNKKEKIAEKKSVSNSFNKYSLKAYLDQGQRYKERAEQMESFFDKS